MLLLFICRVCVLFAPLLLRSAHSADVANVSSTPYFKIRRGTQHFFAETGSFSVPTASQDELLERVRNMFYGAYDAYMKYAYPEGELRPLSCSGGEFEPVKLPIVTLIDTLDLLAIMGDYEEFRRAVQLIKNQYASFDLDVNVSVFETTIRLLGGLLSAHLMAVDPALGIYRRIRKGYIELDASGLVKKVREIIPSSSQPPPGAYCSDTNDFCYLQRTNSSAEGPRYDNWLLTLALDLGVRLLPAFQTKTGIPIGTVNLRHGVPVGETVVASTAGAGSLLLEFEVLSRLTGMSKFGRAADKATKALYKRRSNVGLVGKHINTGTGSWVEVISGIGSNSDSFYEYLLKAYALFQKSEYLGMFSEVFFAIKEYVQVGDWFSDVDMYQGQNRRNRVESLHAFWPGLETGLGLFESSARLLNSFYTVWNHFGFFPEEFDQANWIDGKGVHGSTLYPLRPELIESTYHQYRATGDASWIRAGELFLDALERRTKTDCGYASIADGSYGHNVQLMDTMPSFFLSETCKYLYLLFDEDNFIHRNRSYVFSTEAHPFDPVQLPPAAASAAAAYHSAKREGEVGSSLSAGASSPPTSSLGHSIYRSLPRRCPKPVWWDAPTSFDAAYLLSSLEIVPEAERNKKIKWAERLSRAQVVAINAYADIDAVIARIDSAAAKSPNTPTNTSEAEGRVRVSTSDETSRGDEQNVFAVLNSWELTLGTGKANHMGTRSLLSRPRRADMCYIDSTSVGVIAGTLEDSEVNTQGSSQVAKPAPQNRKNLHKAKSQSTVELSTPKMGKFTVHIYADGFAVTSDGFGDEISISNSKDFVSILESSKNERVRKNVVADASGHVYSCSVSLVDSLGRLSVFNAHEMNAVTGQKATRAGTWERACALAAYGPVVTESVVGHPIVPLQHDPQGCKTPHFLPPIARRPYPRVPTASLPFPASAALSTALNLLRWMQGVIAKPSPSPPRVAIPITDIAVARRGVCLFEDKSTNAQNAGVDLLIIANTEENIFTMSGKRVVNSLKPRRATRSRNRSPVNQPRKAPGRRGQSQQKDGETLTRSDDESDVATALKSLHTASSNTHAGAATADSEDDDTVALDDIAAVEIDGGRRKSTDESEENMADSESTEAEDESSAASDGAAEAEVDGSESVMDITTVMLSKTDAEQLFALYADRQVQVDMAETLISVNTQNIPIVLDNEFMGYGSYPQVRLASNVIHIIGEGHWGVSLTSATGTEWQLYIIAKTDMMMVPYMLPVEVYIPSHKVPNISRPSENTTKTTVGNGGSGGAGAKESSVNGRGVVLEMCSLPGFTANPVEQYAARLKAKCPTIMHIDGNRLVRQY